jgi:hypothetical protein
MSKKTLVWISIIAGVFLLIVAIAGVGFFLLQRQQEHAKTEGMPPKFPPAPLPVMTANLKTSDLDRKIETGDTLPLVGKVFSSSPIIKLELWINGQKVDERVPVEGWEKTDFTVLWSWTPPGAGEYDLITRGIDAKGVSNYSNMVTIIVSQAPMDANGQKIQPTPDAAKSTPVADMVFIPTSPINFAEQAQPGDIDPGAKKPNIGGLGEVSSPNNPSPPPGPDAGDESSPTLKIKVTGSVVDNCTHRLEISTDNPDFTYFLIYAFTPSNDYDPSASGYIENFQKDLDPSSPVQYTEYLDTSPKTIGTYQYLVKGVHPYAGEISAGYVDIFQEDASCASDWNGEVFVDIKMTTVEDYQNLYCFARLNEMEWGRMPVLDNTFLVRMNEQDMELYLETLRGGGAGRFVPVSNTKIYDLNPFAPDWTQTGWEKFTLWVKCADTSSDAFVDLGVVQEDIDLQTPGTLKVLENENYKVQVYINRDSNVVTGSGSAKYLKIAPPYNLTYTRDPNTCNPDRQTRCGEMIAQNNVIIHWNWNPEQCVAGDDTNVACVKDIAGFNIYRVAFGGDEIVETIPMGWAYGKTENDFNFFVEYPDEDYSIKETDTDIIKAIKTLLGRRAFYVKAYSADLESERTNIVELEPPPPPPQAIAGTREFQPSSRNVYINGSTLGEDTFYGLDDNQARFNVGPSQVYTGFLHVADPSTYWVQYGLFRFDLSSLEGANIVNAELKLNETYSSYYGCNENGWLLAAGGSCKSFGFPTPVQTTCASKLMIMNRDSTGGYYSSPPDVTTSKNSINNGKGALDVTYEVKMWTEGSIPNYGFLLWTEDLWIVSGDARAWGCDSVYGPVSLIVEYTQ